MLNKQELPEQEYLDHLNLFSSPSELAQYFVQPETMKVSSFLPLKITGF